MMMDDVKWHGCGSSQLAGSAIQQVEKAQIIVKGSSDFWLRCSRYAACHQPFQVVLRSWYICS